MTQDYLISELCQYALETGLIEKEDLAYARNGIMAVMKITDITPCEVDSVRPLHVILGELCDEAYARGIIKENGVVYRDLFDTEIMGVLTARPSEVIRKFDELYKVNPASATDYFYSLAKASNYIRTDRIAKDLKWQVDSEYGKIDVTVNLSKPEKDPKAIAAAKLLPQSGYPKCLLCHDNEGYAGTLSKPARQNLRQIPFDMAGERWYIQYSPYVYYNEHCIALSGEHTPMAISEKTFAKLLGFTKHFPHYFIGSNADLPIVGGSILSHDHMQGGRYEFAMERAEIDTPLHFTGYDDVTAGIVKWPMSVIRLTSDSTESIIRLATKILNTWRSYSDADAYIYAETDGERHNTITPIARRRGEKYELDLVLRNNITTDEHPLGLYHPHSELHNIKKENIGLIEVMGLAVLPARLKGELADLRAAILNGADLTASPTTAHHAAWVDSFRHRYTFTEENTEQILRDEVGKAFVRVLCDAGVYKDTPEGRRAFMRFLKSVGIE